MPLRIDPDALLAATEAYREARLRGIPPEMAAKAGNSALSRALKNDASALDYESHRSDVRGPGKTPPIEEVTR